jgi:hypothetical protein
MRRVGVEARARPGHLANMREFNELRAKLLKARRESEAARNLVVAVEIRDDPGENLAADRTVRLKAAQFIEGNERPGVVVNVNQQTNVPSIQPGYVIRLPASRAGRDAIEGNVSP